MVLNFTDEEMDRIDAAIESMSPEVAKQIVDRINEIYELDKQGKISKKEAAGIKQDLLKMASSAEESQQGSGMLARAGKAALKGAAYLGERVERVGGGPTKAAFREAVAGDISKAPGAFYEKFGAPYEEQIPGEQIAVEMGVETDPGKSYTKDISEISGAIGSYSIGEELVKLIDIDPEYADLAAIGLEPVPIIKFAKAVEKMTGDVSDAKAVGLLIDLGIDWLNIGVGPAIKLLRGFGKAAVNAGKLAAKTGAKTGLFTAKVGAHLFQAQKLIDKLADISARLSRGKKISGIKKVSPISRPKLILGKAPTEQEVKYIKSFLDERGITAELPSKFLFKEGEGAVKIEETAKKTGPSMARYENDLLFADQVEEALRVEPSRITGASGYESAVAAGEDIKEGVIEGIKSKFDELGNAYDNAGEKIMTEHGTNALSETTKSRLRGFADRLDEEAAALSESTPLEVSASGSEKYVEAIAKQADILRNISTYREAVSVLRNVGKLAYRPGKKIAALPSDELSQIWQGLNKNILGEIEIKLSKQWADKTNNINKSITQVIKDKTIISPFKRRRSDDYFYNSLIKNGSEKTIAAVKNLVDPEIFKRVQTQYLDDLLKERTITETVAGSRAKRKAVEGFDFLEQLKRNRPKLKALGLSDEGIEGAIDITPIKDLAEISRKQGKAIPPKAPGYGPSFLGTALPESVRALPSRVLKEPRISKLRGQRLAVAAGEAEKFAEIPTMASRTAGVIKTGLGAGMLAEKATAVDRFMEEGGPVMREPQALDPNTLKARFNSVMKTLKDYRVPRTTEEVLKNRELIFGKLFNIDQLAAQNFLVVSKENPDRIPDLARQLTTIAPNLFEPAKYPSQFDGKISGEDVQKYSKQVMGDINLSNIEKAKRLSDVNRDGSIIVDNSPKEHYETVKSIDALKERMYKMQTGQSRVDKAAVDLDIFDPQPMPQQPAPQPMPTVGSEEEIALETTEERPEETQELEPINIEGYVR